jgi:N-acetylglucosamine repressor
MRKINPDDFSVARRTTSRDINRRIALNLIHTHQPISRADLARKMKVGRGAVTLLTNELIKDGIIYEGATGNALRGRKPTFLYVRTEDRMVLAVDVRFSRIYLMLTDFAGRQLALETFQTILEPERFLSDLIERIRRMLKNYDAAHRCEGIGLVVPGVVNPDTGEVLLSPTIGWQKLNLKKPLEAATGLPVKVENAPKACALAQMWLGRGAAEARVQNFVYVSVSDGVGVGIVTNGELLRGLNNSAGEFGHIPLEINGAQCLCGRRGCWEAYISNLATTARYLGEDLSKLQTNERRTAKSNNFTINDVIVLARSGNQAALNALMETARYLGWGLANIVNFLNPERVYIGGEITTAWDLISAEVRKVLKQNCIVAEGGDVFISIASTSEYPRLKGAASLVVAPAFAALKVA